MRVIFVGDGRVVTWELPMLKRDDDRTIMNWAQDNKEDVQAINTVTQLGRAICDAFAPKDR
jgi:hypothetical protein